MENFRLFLIRLLQAAWVLLIIAIVATVIIESTFVYLFGFGLVVGIPLVLIQFLIFGQINPLDLFNGHIKQNLIK